MAISGDYRQPVLVNGFTCRNCTDVELAKKHIDPAHPKSGPFGVDAAHDPSRQTAFTLDGAAAAASATPPTSGVTPYQPGQLVSVRV